MILQEQAGGGQVAAAQAQFAQGSVKNRQFLLAGWGHFVDSHLSSILSI
jgi:hypothetical protein